MLISNEQCKEWEGESHEPLPRLSTYCLFWATSLLLVIITLLGLGQWPHKAYPLIWRGLEESPAWPRGWATAVNGPALQWVSDLLPGWFASSSRHLLLLDYHLPVPVIIKVLEIVSHLFGYQGSSGPGKAPFCSSELQCYPGWAPAALYPQPYPRQVQDVSYALLEISLLQATHASHGAPWDKIRWSWEVGEMGEVPVAGT